MQKNEISHSCRNCGLALPFVYRGRRISEKEFEELQTSGKTSWTDGYKKKDLNSTLCGRLILSGNTLSFEVKTLSAKCPKCKSTILKDKNKWLCSSCDFSVNEKLFGRKFSQEEIEKLVFHGQTDNFDNFVSSSTGKIFAGFVSIEDFFELKMNFLR
jgi:ribosomal protein S27AE